MSLRVVGGEGEGKGGRPSGEFDPWDTEKGHEYNEDHFYTRSTNKHDHSIDVRFRFPPHLGAMVSEIVDSKRFPQLRTVADFYRDAAIHRLHYLNAAIKDGKFQRAITLEMRLARTQQRQQEMTELQDIVNKHAETLETAKQTRDFEVLGEVIGFVEDDISELRQPYRGQLVEMLAKYRAELKRHIESGEGVDNDGS